MEQKNKMIIAAGACACVLAGAGMEHVRQRLAEPLPDVEDVRETVRVTPTPGRVVTVRDEAAERVAEALRKRVAELEKTLAERDTARAQQPEKPQVADENAGRGEGRDRRQSWEERMEQMRKDNPEQYAEMQRRREEFRQGVEQRVRERADVLDAVDVAGMTPEQRQNHEQLLATVARVNDLMAGMMMEGGRPRGEEGEALRREMGEAMASLGQLYESERRYLLEATAKAAGYTGSDAQAFTELIQAIYENTSMMPGGFGRRGGAPAAGGGGRR